MIEPHAAAMTDRLVRVRCQELAPVIGDREGNLAAIGNAVRGAMDAGIELLVLPELATSGYFLTPDEAWASALPAASDVFREWASELSARSVLVVGFCELDGHALYNSAAVLTAGGVVAVYRKAHLWNAEKELFTPGDAPPVVLDSPVGRLGTLICYDLEFPEMPRRLALAGAEIIVVPTNWPVVPKPPREHAPEVVQAMAAARASQVAIACCDRRGEERGETWTRGTVVVGPDGWPLGEKDHDGRLDVTIELRMNRFDIGPRNHVHRDRRPPLYG